MPTDMILCFVDVILYALCMKKLLVRVLNAKDLRNKI